MAFVRKGRSADLPRVLELIKELAVFEKAPAEVKVSIPEMQDNFENRRLFDFFVLEQDGQVLGIALYYFKYSTWKGRCLFLEDLIVTEAERNKGYGKMLFEEVLKVAGQENTRRMEWQVLNWNKNAIRFYEKYQTHFDDEWTNCKLLHSQLKA